MFGRTGWICNKCNNFNFESRNRCNRCFCNKDPKTIEEINKKKEEREKSNLMIAADGDLISVKKMVIKQSSRNSYINYKNNNNFSDDSVQSCSCCNII